MRFFILVDLLRGTVHGVVEAASLEVLQRWNPPDRFAVTGNPEGYSTEVEAKQQLRNLSNDPAAVLETIQKQKRVRDEQAQVQKNLAEFIAQDPIANKDNLADRVAESDVDSSKRKVEPRSTAEQVKQQLKNAGSLGDTAKAAAEINSTKLGSLEGTQPYSENTGSPAQQPPRIGTLSDLSDVVRNRARTDRTSGLRVQSTRLGVTQAGSASELAHRTSGSIMRPVKGSKSVSADRFGPGVAPTSATKVLDRVQPRTTKALGYGGQPKVEAKLTDVSTEVKSLVERSTEIIRGELGTEATKVLTRISGVKRAEGVAESYFDPSTKTLVIGDNLNKNLKVLNALGSQKGAPAESRANAALQAALELRHEIIHSAVGNSLKNSSLNIRTDLELTLEEGLTEQLNRLGARKFMQGLLGKNIESLNKAFDLLEASSLSGTTDPILAGVTNQNASKSLSQVAEFMNKLGITKPEDITAISKLVKLDHEPSERAERLMWWGKQTQQRDGTTTAAIPKPKKEKTSSAGKKAKTKDKVDANKENLERINKTTAPKPTAGKKERAPKAKTVEPFQLLDEYTADNKKILRIAAIGADAHGRHGVMADSFAQERNRIKSYFAAALDRDPNTQLRVVTNLQPGFGLLAAEAALELRAQGRNVTLDIVLAQQDAHLEAYPVNKTDAGHGLARRISRERAEAVLNQANRVIIATDKSSQAAVAERLDTAAKYIVQHSDEVLTGGRLSLGGKGAVFERGLDFALSIGKKIHKLAGSFDFGQAPEPDLAHKFRALNIQRATVLAGYSIPSLQEYKQFVERHPGKADDVQAFIEFRTKNEIEGRARTTSITDATKKTTADQANRSKNLSRHGVSETTGAQSLAHATEFRQLVNEGDNVPSAAHKNRALEVKPFGVSEQTAVPPAAQTAGVAPTATGPSDSSSTGSSARRSPAPGNSSFSFAFTKVPEGDVDYRTVQFSKAKSALSFLKDVSQTKLSEGQDVDASLTRSSDKQGYTRYRYNEKGELERTTYNPQTKGTTSSVISEKEFIREFQQTQSQNNLIKEKLNVTFYGARKPAEGPSTGAPQPSLMRATDQTTGKTYDVTNANQLRFLYKDIDKVKSESVIPKEVVDEPLTPRTAPTRPRRRPARSASTDTPNNTQTPVIKQTPRVGEHYGALSLDPRLSSSTGPGRVAPLPTFSPSATGTPLAPMTTTPTWAIPGALEQHTPQNQMEVRTKVGKELPQPADYRSAITSTLRTSGPQGIRSLLSNLNTRTDMDAELSQKELRGHLDKMVESGIVTRSSRGKYALSEASAAEVMNRTSPSAGRAATMGVGVAGNPLLPARGNLEAQAAYMVAIEETRTNIRQANAQGFTAGTVPTGVIPTAGVKPSNNIGAALDIVHAVHDVTGPRKPTIPLSVSGVSVSGTVPMPSAAETSRAASLVIARTEPTPPPQGELWPHVQDALDRNPKGFRLKDITEAVNNGVTSRNAALQPSSLQSMPSVLADRSTVTPTTTRISQEIPAPVGRTSLPSETRPMSWVLPADKEAEVNSRQVRDYLQERVAAGDLTQKPSGEYTYSDRVTVPSGTNVLTSSQTRTAVAPTAMQQALASVRNAFKASSIESFMTGLDGIVAPTSKEMRGIAGGIAEVVGGLVLSERVLKPIFGQKSEHSNQDLVKESAALAAGTLLFSSKAGMTTMMRMNQSQSMEDAKRGFVTMMAGMAGSALAKAGASIALPSMPMTRSAAGLIGSTMAWAAAPIVASVFVQFKEASQQHMSRAEYVDGTDMQSVTMANDIVLQLSESAEVSFTAEVISEDGEEIEFEDGAEFDEISEVENEFGEPLPFDVNLSVNPFVPGKQ